MSSSSHPLTVFHITHQKAGSQWVAEILKYSAPERFITPKAHNGHVRHTAIQSGKIYPTIYLNRNRFRQILYWRSANRSNPLLKNKRIFIVIRDLRDTLVSAYYSYKLAHPNINSDVENLKRELNRISFEEGLIYLMNGLCQNYAAIQRSWMNSPYLFIRYEELLANEHKVFQSIIDYCEINVDPQVLYYIIENNRFINVTGRAPGMEDVSAHQRKGIAGDWKNYCL